MMRKLDQEGAAAFEFCIVAIPLFILMFAIFDFGRYAMTMQSLRALANAGARAMMINCYTTNVIQNASPAGCTGDPLPTEAEKKAIAPFLYAGGFTPTLNTALVGSKLTVTASSDFTMVVSVWGTAFNGPSASTSVPF